MNIRRYLPTLGFLIPLAVFPTIISYNNYFLNVGTFIVIYATIVAAWNIIGGFAGQLDLGAGAYMGVGIFTTGILLLWWNITPIIGIFISGLAAAALGVIIGYPTFRFGIREVWYALSSLALVSILQKIFLVWEEVAGPVERRLPYFAASLYHLRFYNYAIYFYMALALLAITLILNVKIRYTKTGYYLLAIRENEEAAEMLGVDVRKYKLIALMIYSFIVGITGGIFVLIAGYYHPTLFDPWISIQTAILGIVGGLGAIFGAPLTALIILTIAEYLRFTLGGIIQGLHLIIYAIILILVVLFKPEGLSEFFYSVYRYIAALSKRRQ